MLTKLLKLVKKLKQRLSDLTTIVSHFLLKNYYQNQKLRKKLQLKAKKHQQRRNQLNLVLRNSKKEQKAQLQRNQEQRKKRKKKNQNNGYLDQQMLHSETYSKVWISKSQTRIINNLFINIKKESGFNSRFFLLSFYILFFSWLFDFWWKCSDCLSC